MTTRTLDADELAALEEQRAFLLASLEDLEREHDAGDVDDHDYEALRDDYTARAAQVIRAIENRRARVSAAPAAHVRRRMLATVGGIVAIALLAGVLVQQLSGDRSAGDNITGDIRQSTRDQLDQAAGLVRSGDWEAAVDLYDEILDEQPDNVEAMANKGWVQFQAGDASGVVALVDAAELDPDYPITHYFLAIAFAQLGRVDSALDSLDRLERLDPPPDLLTVAQQLRDELTRSQASTATTAPP